MTKSFFTSSFLFQPTTWLSIIAFLIPLEKRLIPIVIVLFLIVTLFTAFRTKRKFFSKKEIPLYLLVAYFLLLIIGVSNSENVEYAWVEISYKLSFLAFPVLGVLLPRIEKDSLSKIEQFFVVGSIAYLILAIAIGVFHTVTMNDTGYLSYILLSNPYHPTYAATYQAMALFILIRNAAEGNFVFRKEWVHWILVFLIILFISMLASKAGILAGVISIAMGGYVLLKKRISTVRTGALTAIMLSFCILTTLFLPGAMGRVDDAIGDINTPQLPSTNDLGKNIEQSGHYAESSTALRLVTWSSAWELLLKNPMGVGTGDTTNELVKIYQAKGEVYAEEKALNAHNQFLQSGSELGWPGLLIIIAVIALLFVQYLMTRTILMLNFLLLISMNFMFESFIEVQAGIVFFCFWILVFVLSIKSNLNP